MHPKIPVKKVRMFKSKKRSLSFQIGVILFCLLSLSVSAAAQRRSAKKPVPKATPKIVTSFVIKDESEKVAIQIKNLTRFIYVLGGIANVIEAVDKDARAGKVSPAGLRQNQANKQTVLQTIRNVRAGVVQLENDFHSRPELRPYIIYIQGVSEMAGVAEDQAVAGQLSTAGKTLLEVVNRLTDTLQNLR
jgi:hypothetical protein